VELPKYAKLENERRWLIMGEGPDLASASGRTIEDWYLEGGRLRLRRALFDDGRIELKLCKKYGSADPISQPIVNIYLDESEYGSVRALPGRLLLKRRYSVPPFGVDVFEGALAGLRMCEAEAETLEGVASFEPPPWAAPEVTRDSRFSGAVLAHTSSADLDRLMRSALDPRRT
jgi:CYTH domain-containing protein